MKFTPSSSVSSTTSNTSISVSDTFCTAKVNNFGCLFGFLTRILSSKTIPTYPIESEKKEHFLNVVDGSTTPNVVAKLMGLDSIPEFRGRVNEIKPRNSDEFRVGGTGDFERQHHRAKTSFSFKETPDFFELQDDDFFLPRKIEKKKKKKKTKKKKRENWVKFEQKGNGRVFSIEDRLNLPFSAQNSQNFDNNVGVRHQNHYISPLKENPASKKEETDGIRARKKKKKKESFLVDSKEEEEEEGRESDRENLSPVSVLDHCEFSTDHEPATSGSGELPNEENTTWDDEKGVDGKCGEGYYKRREWRKHEMLKKRAYKLAEGEIANNNSKNRAILRTEELEDAGTLFGQLIFDQLVNEFVHQLVQFHYF